MMPGPFQILIILVLVLLVFGASRVPNIAENLAKGITAFKRGLKDDGEDQKSLSDRSKDQKD